MMVEGLAGPRGLSVSNYRQGGSILIEVGANAYEWRIRMGAAPKTSDHDVRDAS